MDGDRKASWKGDQPWKTKCKTCCISGNRITSWQLPDRSRTVRKNRQTQIPPSHLSTRRTPRASLLTAFNQSPSTIEIISLWYCTEKPTLTISKWLNVSLGSGINYGIEAMGNSASICWYILSAAPCFCVTCITVHLIDPSSDDSA